jgi:hypothetical protein
MDYSAVPESKYKRKSFDRQKYVVDGYQYPSDLMGTQSSQAGFSDTTPRYGGNYVVFYINVNNESRMVTNPDGTENNTNTTTIDASDRVLKNLAGKAYSQEAVVAAQVATGAGLGTLVGAGGGGFGGGLTGAATGGAVVGLGGAAVAANTKNSTFSRPQKRLKTAIALHVPNQLSIRYGAGWSDEETFALQALISGGKEAGRALETAGKALMNGNGGEAKSAIVGGAKGVSSIVANVALNRGPNAGALSAMTGLAPNPMKEQVFKGVDFRTFTMEYQFAPRNKTEAENVYNIINAFKYHMHPEYKDSNNFLFLYPSEFDISYFHMGVENKYIHRHTSCVLTEFNVNYTPNGNFTTFEGGMPTQINVSMSFKELTVLTKEHIAEGL